MSTIQKELTNKGFVITEMLFDPELLKGLLTELENIGAFDYQQPQIPDLLKASGRLKSIANDKPLIALLNATTGEKMFPVKAFILDKSTESNWEIPWHQDLKITINKKVDQPGYTNWSLESGILHVQPPVTVMEKLVTLRIHFDACDAKNAAIHVIAGSHKLGILGPLQIEEIVACSSAHLCDAAKFSVMLMKPLILHYSPESKSSRPRRILQIEYGYEIGSGIAWRDREGNYFA